MNDFLKDWKMPSAKQLRKRFCEENLKKLIPKRCSECGSKYLYYDPMAGPMVGGIGTWKHPPNNHPSGAWICLDCAEKESKKERKLQEERKLKEAPEQIEKKRKEIQKLEKEVKELEELIK